MTSALLARERGDAMVAALCVGRRSVYHALAGVDAYDIDRDACTFLGGMPVIAHPPCRAWSAWCAHQAKPAEGERELGLWCADQVRQWGGVLEQPAHSRLFDAAGLPKPRKSYVETFLGEAREWSIEVSQAWFGYPMKKRTWLYFSGVDRATVRPPIKLHPQGFDRRREQLMSKSQRAETTREFAEWLIAIARTARRPERIVVT